MTPEATDQLDLSEKIPPLGGRDLASLDRVIHFIQNVDRAALLLSTVYVDGQHRMASMHKARRRAPENWYSLMIDSSVQRLIEIRRVFKSRHKLEGPAMAVEREAVRLLCELTPAKHTLLDLVVTNFDKAIGELGPQLEVLENQYGEAAALAERVADAKSDGSSLLQEQASLLERAYGGLSVAEAGELLNMTRQAFHKKINAGNALGLMLGKKSVVPRLQFEQVSDEYRILPGIAEIVKLFEEGQAGGWSALQFLLEVDPNLVESPIDALRAHRPVEDVIHAAQSYLGLNEGGVD